MNEHFPSINDISPDLRTIVVYYNDEFQYVINNDIQLNNLRIWAVANKQTKNIYFKWDEYLIKIDEAGNLLTWPRGMFDTQLRQLAELINLRKGLSTGKFYK